MKRPSRANLRPNSIWEFSTRPGKWSHKITRKPSNGIGWRRNRNAVRRSATSVFATRLAGVCRKMCAKRGSGSAAQPARAIKPRSTTSVFIMQRSKRQRAPRLKPKPHPKQPEAQLQLCANITKIVQAGFVLLAQQFVRLRGHYKIAFRQAVDLVGPNRELHLTPGQVNI